jgi:hypothetical protein
VSHANATCRPASRSLSSAAADCHRTSAVIGAHTGGHTGGHTVAPPASAAALLDALRSRSASWTEWRPLFLTSRPQPLCATPL